METGTLVTLAQGFHCSLLDTAFSMVLLFLCSVSEGTFTPLITSSLSFFLDGHRLLKVEGRFLQYPLHSNYL